MGRKKIVCFYRDRCSSCPYDDRPLHFRKMLKTNPTEFCYHAVNFHFSDWEIKQGVQGVTPYTRSKEGK